MIRERENVVIFDKCHFVFKLKYSEFVHREARPPPMNDGLEKIQYVFSMIDWEEKVRYEITFYKLAGRK